MGLGCLGQSWCVSGVSGARRGYVLEHQGCVLEGSWGVMGGSWRDPGKSWKLPGSILETFLQNFLPS